MVMSGLFSSPVTGFVTHNKLQDTAFHQLTVGEEGGGIIYAIEFDGLDIATLVGKSGSDDGEILAVAEMNGRGG